ncbi:hypothetical protein IDH44_08655 [Paenibacillus sp. IB182496]|uniref:DUF2802 domain-containing protein n=1 Tax=Paenibacillus sabuli TaxID=2772509 RepID=A0A927BTJ4_9BACL|nr:hypothetical protein [Paenibacillus sabuli]MBD2845259.1 hypothetical protein [Paenibacillus sabuli]
MDEPWIYIVLLGAFAIVCALLLPRRKPAEAASAGLSEMEMALEHFMETMESDNRKLVDNVTHAQQKWRDDLEAKERQVERLSARCDALEEGVARLQEQLAERSRAASDRARGSGGLSTAEASGARAGSRSEEEHNSGAGVPSGSEAVSAEAGDSSISARYSELLSWHAEGKSIEYIAKKSGMHKGEVMLILQLSKQEERHRA